MRDSLSCDITTKINCAGKEHTRLSALCLILLVTDSIIRECKLNKKKTFLVNGAKSLKKSSLIPIVFCIIDSKPADDNLA